MYKKLDTCPTSLPFVYTNCKHLYKCPMWLSYICPKCKQLYKSVSTVRHTKILRIKQSDHADTRLFSQVDRPPWRHISSLTRLTAGLGSRPLSIHSETGWKITVQALVRRTLQSFHGSLTVCHICLGRIYRSNNNIYLVISNVLSVISRVGFVQ